MSRRWDVAQLKSRANEMSRKWVVTQMKSRATGLSRRWDTAQLKYRATRRSRSWNVTQVGCRARKKSRKWHFPEFKRSLLGIPPYFFWRITFEELKTPDYIRRLYLPVSRGLTEEIGGKTRWWKPKVAWGAHERMAAPTLMGCRYSVARRPRQCGGRSAASGKYPHTRSRIRCVHWPLSKADEM